jgi:hypothetical protein
MTQQDQLAHELAAGFLEKASQFAAKFGPDNLQDAMRKALRNLQADYTYGTLDIVIETVDPGTARAAVLRACQIASATLAADTRSVN